MRLIKFPSTFLDQLKIHFLKKIIIELQKFPVGFGLLGHPLAVLGEPAVLGRGGDSLEVLSLELGPDDFKLVPDVIEGGPEHTIHILGLGGGR